MSFIAKFILATPTRDTLTYRITRMVTFLKQYFRNLDWEHILTEVISKLSLIVIMTLFILIIRKIGLRFIRSGFKKSKKGFDAQRIDTVYIVTKNIFEYMLFFVFSYTFLKILGVPVESLLAGAGILGVAIGLGAQGFISDLITGFNIILERQLDVGDAVKINDIVGTVEQIGLRTTQIKSVDGTLHFIPNRTILLISNSSRNDMLVQVDIRLNPTDDLQKVEDVVKEVNKQMYPIYEENITSGPNVLGLTDLGNGEFAFRVNIYVENGLQYKIKRDYLQAYVEELKQEGIIVNLAPVIAPIDIFTNK